VDWTARHDLHALRHRRRVSSRWRSGSGWGNLLTANEQRSIAYNYPGHQHSESGLERPREHGNASDTVERSSAPTARGIGHPRQWRGGIRQRSISVKSIIVITGTTHLAENVRAFAAPIRIMTLLLPIVPAYSTDNLPSDSQEIDG
jgi:hypothetical protein